MKIQKVTYQPPVGSVLRLDADVEALDFNGRIFPVKLKSRTGLGSGLPHEALFTVLEEQKTKPLAERITQGPYKRIRYTGDEDSHKVCTALHNICGGSNKLCGADAELILEAFNVTHETGKTPRELANLVEELESEIQAFHEQAAGASI